MSPARLNSITTGIYWPPVVAVARLSFGIYVPTKSSAASIMGTKGRRVGSTLKAPQDRAAWRSARTTTFSRLLDPTQRLDCGRQMDAS